MIARTEDSFTAFVHSARDSLNVALTAAYGPETGHEAAAEALAYAWRHWDRVNAMEQPIAYLYRVGQSKARRHLAWLRRRACPPAPSSPEPWIEPALPGALQTLSRRQRTAVVLVCGFGWTQREVADLLGVSRSTVEQHLTRGLSRLRHYLKVTP